MRDEAQDAKSKELYAQHLGNLADYVALHAKDNPEALALIEHDTGDQVSWKDFEMSVSAFAAQLLSAGLKKGDIIATSLPLLKEHVYLMYACFRLGIIIAPLDLRLKTAELSSCIEKMQPKAYFFLGKTPVADFRPMIKEVMQANTSIKHWVQFQPEADFIMEGAVGIKEFTKDIANIYVESLSSGIVEAARKQVDKRDPCLIIFTTGSTGSPKPALICHENILVQNICLVVASSGDPAARQLVNLPPSHVGCVTEQLLTTIYNGGTSVLLHVFDPQKTLEAIQTHKVTHLGQIPALFNMEWRLPDYATYDLSSLRFAVYGGQAVSREFLVKMQEMAPRIGTGLGLTETAGFCTYTKLNADVDELTQGIGYDNILCPISIREPMQPDGTAGREKPKTEVGEICFSGPQIFLGYLGDQENTAKTISRDGICYTGDLGYYDEKGLHFAGRSKMVIKPKGYQVFPEDVEKHIMRKLKGKISVATLVGVEHEVFSEGIMAFVECLPEQNVSAEDVMNACYDISAYSRPSHVVVYQPGEMPLNRVAKTDYMILKDRAKNIVNILRGQGKWDRN